MQCRCVDACHLFLQFFLTRRCSDNGGSGVSAPACRTEPSTGSTHLFRSPSSSWAIAGDTPPALPLCKWVGKTSVPSLGARVGPPLLHAHCCCCTTEHPSEEPSCHRIGMLPCMCVCAYGGEGGGGACVTTPHLARIAAQVSTAAVLSYPASAPSCSG